MNKGQNHRLLLSLAALTIVISMPSLLRIPRVLPFLRTEVRAAAPAVLQELRSQGLWLVNADLLGIEESNGILCFTFEYQYRGGGTSSAPRIITPCTFHAS